MKLSAVEALCNAVVGLLVSWAITYYALPLWGLTPSAKAYDTAVLMSGDKFMRLNFVGGAA